MLGPRIVLAVGLLAPVLGLAVPAAPAQSGGQGCTPCECAVAYCRGNTTYWPHVKIEHPEDPRAGTPFQLDIELTLEMTEEGSDEGNATFNDTLWITYEYGDNVSLANGTNRSGQLYRSHPIQYPGHERVDVTLPAAGAVELLVRAGRSDARTIHLDVRSGSSEDGAQIPGVALVGTLAASLTVAVSWRRS